jgi:hypothetical protein
MLYFVCESSEIKKLWLVKFCLTFGIMSICWRGFRGSALYFSFCFQIFFSLALALIAKGTTWKCKNLFSYTNLPNLISRIWWHQNFTQWLSYGGGNFNDVKEKDAHQITYMYRKNLRNYIT